MTTPPSSDDILADAFREELSYISRRGDPFNEARNALADRGPGALSRQTEAISVLSTWLFLHGLLQRREGDDSAWGWVHAGTVLRIAHDLVVGVWSEEAYLAAFSLFAFSDDVRAGKAARFFFHVQPHSEPRSPTDGLLAALGAALNPDIETEMLSWGRRRLGDYALLLDAASKDKLERAIPATCDYHLARGRPVGDGEYHEWQDYPWAIEVVGAATALAKRRKWQIELPDHPCLPKRWRKFPNFRHVRSNSEAIDLCKQYLENWSFTGWPMPSV